MSERLGDGVENSFIEMSLQPAKFEIHFASALRGYIAHHAGKAPKKLVDRDHANLHDRALQIVQCPRLEGHGVSKFATQQFLGIAFAEFDERLLQHRLADDEFPDQI